MAAFKGKKDQITVSIVAEMTGDDMKKTKVRFRGTYKKLSVQDAKETMRRAHLDEDDSDRLTDEDIIARDLVSWSDLKDADEQLLPYDEEARDEAMDMDGYHKALMSGWFMVQFKTDPTKAKN